MVAIVHLYLVLWCGESCIYWDGYKHKIGKLKLRHSPSKLKIYSIKIRHPHSKLKIYNMKIRHTPSKLKIYNIKIRQPPIKLKFYNMKIRHPPSKLKIYNITTFEMMIKHRRTTFVSASAFVNIMIFNTKLLNMFEINLIRKFYQY